jgi:hypothetical protein
MTTTPFLKTGTPDTQVYQKVVSQLQDSGGLDHDTRNPLPVTNKTWYLYEITRGNIPGTTFFNANGFAEVDNTQFSVVGTAFVGRYPFPGTAETINLVSTSADDSLTGDGMRTIIINGLDADFAQQLEVVSMNGTTTVTSALEFFRINSITIFSCGSARVNKGVVTATNSDSGDQLAVLDVEEGLSSLAVYSVAADKTASLYQALVNTAKDDDAQLSFLFCLREFEGSPIVRTSTQRIYQSEFKFSDIIPFALQEKTDLEVVAKSADSTNAIINVFIGFIVEDN